MSSELYPKVKNMFKGPIFRRDQLMPVLSFTESLGDGGEQEKSKHTKSPQVLSRLFKNKRWARLEKLSDI